MANDVSCNNLYYYCVARSTRVLDCVTDWNPLFQLCSTACGNNEVVNNGKTFCLE